MLRIITTGNQRNPGTNIISVCIFEFLHRSFISRFVLGVPSAITHVCQRHIYVISTVFVSFECVCAYEVSLRLCTSICQPL